MSDKIDEKAESEAENPVPSEAPTEAASVADATEPAEPTQEDFARRVDALAKDEDEGDRIARVEEAKLAERRAKLKKAKKSGLETAASKRLARIGAKDEDRVVSRRTASQAVDGDPLIDRTAQLGKWIEKNSKLVASVVGLAFLGAIGVMTANYLHEKKETDASAELTVAVADQHGRIGDPDKDTSGDRFKDPTPIFKTEAERRDSALKHYREVSGKFAGTGAATLARLAEGGLLLDSHDADGALAAYKDVIASPLGKADGDVRARAMEGTGFAYELKAAQATDGTKPAGADKALDDALHAFKDLESTDLRGFKELGMYHEARVYEAKGDKAKAIETLKSLHERVNKAGENHPFPYLEPVTDDRLRALDPTAIPPKKEPQFGGGPGAHGAGGQPQMSQEQIKKLIEQMQKGGGAGGGGMPPMPMPPPEKK